MELIQEALDNIGDKIRFVEFIPCPVLLAQVKGDQFQTLYLNRSFREIIGYRIQEIPTLEEWFSKAFPEESKRKNAREEWLSEVNHGEGNEKRNTSVKAKIRTKTNGERWFQIRSTAFGGLNAVAFQDIDELEKLNIELTHTNSTKTQLLSILAHDLRTPLIQIISLISLFKNEDLSAEDLYPYLSKLNIQTYLTIDLIDNTLNWVKANSKSIIISKVPFSPIETIQELIALYNDYVKLKSIKVETDLDETLRIVADKDIFRVILRNLFVNALKFSKPGGTITLRARKKENNKNIISILDEGLGMSGEELKKVLSKESFTSPGTLNEGGAGLGIKLCRDFAKLTEAEFWLESEKGKGTSANLVFG
ncbi:two-component sensor histidine kinase [Leptospira sp. 201903071]|uniref:PAS domain-containing sensor histidine kinase n=1 Tax=Leptospira ainazelensis TaxID=2810034 RepID=UPI001965ECEC|nr:PAS domain-containing sensor histidine kinase [Leptospira ainazelensis]MBM9501471.1 two-component sensor histidine kinase [Leptospira ainazelensis]